MRQVWVILLLAFVARAALAGAAGTDPAQHQDPAAAREVGLSAADGDASQAANPARAPSRHEILAARRAKMRRARPTPTPALQPAHENLAAPTPVLAIDSPGHIHGALREEPGVEDEDQPLGYQKIMSC